MDLEEFLQPLGFMRSVSFRIPGKVFLAQSGVTPRKVHRAGSVASPWREIGLEVVDHETSRFENPCHLHEGRTQIVDVFQNRHAVDQVECVVLELGSRTIAGQYTATTSFEKFCGVQAFKGSGPLLCPPIIGVDGVDSNGLSDA